MIRAIVIKTYGDPDFSAAIKTGMTRNLTPEQIAIVKRECRMQNLSRAMEGVKKKIEQQELEEELELMNDLYGPGRPLGKPAEMALQLYGMICYGVSRAYRAVLRGVGM